ncbi:MAG: hypothetical protein K2O12_00450 [Muribaculaceae bacterium]|nr:hypothetical protein [Muribaculaceae bacterium]
MCSAISFRGISKTVADTAVHLCGAFLDVVFPHVCEVCGYSLTPSEKIMCSACRRDLPRVLANGSDTLMHRRLAATPIPVDRVAAYFRYYRGTPYTSLIRNAKYHGRPEIMTVLGYEFADRLAQTGFFRGIDVILPVPMHPVKKLRRGFNQTEFLAKGVAEATGIPVGDNLRVDRAHVSQTKARTAGARDANVSDVFALRNASQLAGLHVLVVDDVITTGATMRSVIGRLAADGSPSSVSVLALAVVPDV